jgi:hypothetical protein
MMIEGDASVASFRRLTGFVTEPRSASLRIHRAPSTESQQAFTEMRRILALKALRELLSKCKRQQKASMET